MAELRSGPNRARSAESVSLESYDTQKSPAPAPASKRICGISKRIFLISAGLAILVILGLAVGLGVGLGLRKDDNTRDNSNAPVRSLGKPIKSARNTGIASATRSDSLALVVYYQSENGSVVEEYYDRSNLAIAKLNETSLKADQTSYTNALDIAPGSPLASVSYQVSNIAWRTLFYVDTEDFVRTTNISARDATWSQGTRISDVPFLKGSPALTACYSPDYRLGLRVFFGTSQSSNGPAIQEVVNSFTGTGNVWTLGQTFDGSDPASGCACFSSRGSNNEPVFNMYSRLKSPTGGSTVGAMSRTTRAGALEGWLPGPSVSLDATSAIATNSSLAFVTNTMGQACFLLYHSADARIGSIGVDCRSPSSPLAAPVKWDTGSMGDGRLAATWPNTLGDDRGAGPMIFYPGSGDQVRWSVVDQGNRVLLNDTLRE